MATIAFARQSYPRLSLEKIDAVVSARLGPTRIPGNEQPACFNRQVAMYLARHVGGWSTTQIGRFYNGRDHSTVCYGIQRIESLRESNPDMDPLLVELRHQLGEDCSEAQDSDARRAMKIQKNA
jgi:chromosomal replication initiator protein